MNERRAILSLNLSVRKGKEWGSFREKNSENKKQTEEIITSIMECGRREQSRKKWMWEKLFQSPTENEEILIFSKMGKRQFLI